MKMDKKLYLLTDEQLEVLLVRVVIEILKRSAEQNVWVC